jgi:cell division transport system permease protein
MFSFASIATMAACIFIFGLFFSIVLNFSYILRNVETNVGITVFFDESIDQASIDYIGSQINARTDLVSEIRYVSADEAWETFSNHYFKGNEKAAEGWKNNNDNPLANSAHYEVYPVSIEQQDELVSMLDKCTPWQKETALELLSVYLKSLNLPV